MNRRSIRGFLCMISLSLKIPTRARVIQHFLFKQNQIKRSKKVENVMYVSLIRHRMYPENRVNNASIVIQWTNFICAREK